MKRGLFFLLLCSIALSLPHLFLKDFKVPPTHSNIPANPRWEAPPPSVEIQTILKQPFTYLAQGSQTCVFQSADQQYVLKLFRYRPTLFPLLHRLKNLFKAKPRQSFFAKMEKTFNAAHLASSEAAQFTQVLYAHLNLTENLFPTVELKADKTYFLPLDRHRFILQRKVLPFKQTLLEARSDSEKMRRLIDSYLLLLERRTALHIRNSDPNLGPNFGFLCEQAVELDFGNYHKVPPNEKRRRSEIAQYLTRLSHFLEKNAPEHVEYVLKEKERLTMMN